MQNYDAVLKLLLRESAGSCLQQLSASLPIGQDVRIERWLNPELQKVRAPRSDLLGETSSGQLLHIEIQSDNDKKMLARMAEYALALYDRESRFPAQIVLYIGQAPLAMPEYLRLPESGAERLEFRCRMLDIRELDGEALLGSPYVGDHILAVLTRLSAHRRTLQQILAKIAEEPPETRKTAYTQLLILAGLRKLETIIKEEASRMPILANIEDHEIFGPVLRQGREQGRQEGRHQQAEQMLSAQLQKRFGPLPAWAKHRLSRASISELDAAAMNLLDATSIEDVFPPRA